MDAALTCMSQIGRIPGQIVTEETGLFTSSE
jgi:hypothetical protein